VLQLPAAAAVANRPASTVARLVLLVTFLAAGPAGGAVMRIGAYKVALAAVVFGPLISFIAAAFPMPDPSVVTSKPEDDDKDDDDVDDFTRKTRDGDNGSNSTINDATSDSRPADMTPNGTDGGPPPLVATTPLPPTHAKKFRNTSGTRDLAAMRMAISEAAEGLAAGVRMFSERLSGGGNLTDTSSGAEHTSNPVRVGIGHSDAVDSSGGNKSQHGIAGDNGDHVVAVDETHVVLADQSPAAEYDDDSYDSSEAEDDGGGGGRVDNDNDVDNNDNDNDNNNIVVQRSEHGPGRSVLASAPQSPTLARLRGMRRRGEAGSLDGAESSYYSHSATASLVPPRAVRRRRWGRDDTSAAALDEMMGHIASLIAEARTHAGFARFELSLPGGAPFCHTTWNAAIDSISEILIFLRAMRHTLFPRLSFSRAITRAYLAPLDEPNRILFASVAAELDRIAVLVAGGTLLQYVSANPAPGPPHHVDNGIAAGNNVGSSGGDPTDQAAAAVARSHAVLLELHTSSATAGQTLLAADPAAIFALLHTLSTVALLARQAPAAAAKISAALAAERTWKEAIGQVLEPVVVYFCAFLPRWNKVAAEGRGRRMLMQLLDALKHSVGATLLALPLFLPSTRPALGHIEYWWLVISYMISLQHTKEATKERAM
jgi:hypothetical protein